jgi:hypothetical protein
MKKTSRRRIPVTSSFIGNILGLAEGVGEGEGGRRYSARPHPLSTEQASG